MKPWRAVPRRETLHGAPWPRLVPPDVDPCAARGQFSAALPERPAIATVAVRLADFDSVGAVLGEPVRFQHDV